MYVKDSIIEAQIEKDLKKEKIKGRIKELERQLSSESNGGLRERLKKLKEELRLLQD
jgi:polyhydroxyalkanoate synthesis regulator phasin